MSRDPAMTEALLRLASNLFPRWREDIQDEFVLQFGYAILSNPHLASDVAEQAYQRGVEVTRSDIAQIRQEHQSELSELRKMVATGYLGNEPPSVQREYDLAAAEARSRGMAFIVHGVHVNADHVMILSMPNTIGPISDMRRAKIDAEAALAEQVSYAELQRQLIEVNQQLLSARRWSAIEFVRDRVRALGYSDTAVKAMGNEIPMMLDAIYQRGIVKGDQDNTDTLRIDWLDAHTDLWKEWHIHGCDFENVRLAMDAGGALGPSTS